MNLGSNNARSRELCKEDGEAVFLGEGKEAVTVPRSWKEVGAGRLCKRCTLAVLWATLTPALQQEGACCQEPCWRAGKG